MITQETLFILGAGASLPYGYPTGNMLRKDIYKSSIASNDFIRILRDDDASVSSKDNIKKWMEDSKNFTETFFRSSTNSIDLFLNRNPQFEEKGKIAITYRILVSEARSRFNEEINEEFRNQNWYHYLFDRMANTLTAPDSYTQFGENKVTFITFNYDRSLECYLFNSLWSSFYKFAEDVNYSESFFDQIKKIPIHHVYGCIGKLPYEEGYLDKPYGFKFKFKDIMEMKENIKIIYEKRSTEMDAVRDLIKKARKIIFLGFGYAKENMEILGFPDILDQHQSIYATAFGLTDAEIQNIRNKIVRQPQFRMLVPNQLKELIVFKNTDCLSLLRDYL
jgi:hypothetical protein